MTETINVANIDKVHKNPIAELVQTACQFESHIDISSEGKNINAKSLMGIMAFGLKGGREVSVSFMDHLKLAAIVTHVADSRTCVLHPASHTHRQMTDEQLIEAGVAPDLIRLSVGTENVKDIIADLEQALENV